MCSQCRGLRGASTSKRAAQPLSPGRLRLRESHARDLWNMPSSSGESRSSWPPVPKPMKPKSGCMRMTCVIDACASPRSRGGSGNGSDGSSSIASKSGGALACGGNHFVASPAQESRLGCNAVGDEPAARFSFKRIVHLPAPSFFDARFAAGNRFEAGGIVAGRLPASCSTTPARSRRGQCCRAIWPALSQGQVRGGRFVPRSIKALTSSTLNMVRAPMRTARRSPSFTSLYKLDVLMPLSAVRACATESKARPAESNFRTTVADDAVVISVTAEALLLISASLCKVYKNWTL